MVEKIYFNGHVYSSETEMPSNVRHQYRRINALFSDRNQDGIPDFLQENGLKGIKDLFEFAKDASKMGSLNTSSVPNQMYSIKVSEQEIVINGRSFQNINDMPSDIRQIYERVVREAEPGNFDIFDESWRTQNRDDYLKPHDDEIISPQLNLENSTPSVHQNVTSNTGIVLLVVVSSIILCIVGIWFITGGFNL